MGLEFGNELVVGQDWNACMFFEVGAIRGTVLASLQ